MTASNPSHHRSQPSQAFPGFRRLTRHSFNPSACPDPHQHGIVSSVAPPPAATATDCWDPRGRRPSSRRATAPAVVPLFRERFPLDIFAASLVGRGRWSGGGLIPQLEVQQRDHFDNTDLLLSPFSPSSTSTSLRSRHSPERRPLQENDHHFDSNRSHRDRKSVV